MNCVGRPRRDFLVFMMFSVLTDENQRRGRRANDKTIGRALSLQENSIYAASSSYPLLRLSALRSQAQRTGLRWRRRGCLPVRLNQRFAGRGRSPANQYRQRAYNLILLAPQVTTQGLGCRSRSVTSSHLRRPINGVRLRCSVVELWRAELDQGTNRLTIADSAPEIGAPVVV